MNENYDTASYARVYQTRAGFHTPTHASIEAKRNLVTSRQRQVINYLQTDGQLKLAAIFSARR